MRKFCEGGGQPTIMQSTSEHAVNKEGRYMRTDLMGMPCIYALQHTFSLLSDMSAPPLLPASGAKALPAVFEGRAKPKWAAAAC